MIKYWVDTVILLLESEIIMKNPIENKQLFLSDESTEEYFFLEDTARRFCERKLKDIFGINSLALKALDLVCETMNKENGFRRDDGQSYYNHCIIVCLTLLNHGIYNEDIICAALLHDIVEDVQDYTVKTLEIMFNKEISTMVDLLTKKPGVDYHITDNLKSYLDGIESNVGTVLIKTADRMHNMLTLKNKSLASKYKKSIETEKFYMPRFKSWRKMFPRYEDLFLDARNSIEPLIFELKNINDQMNQLVELLELSTDDIEKLKKNGISFVLNSENKKKLNLTDD